MNPKGEKLGTYDLEGIKGSPAKPPELDKKLTPALGVLNLISQESESQLQH